MSWGDPMGFATLRQSDAWWLDRWAQCRSADELAGRFGVPVEDVWERLRAAGVEMRGRPPEGQRQLLALPPPEERVFTVRVTPLDGAGPVEDVEVRGLRRRAVAHVVRRAHAAEGRPVSCRVVRSRKP